MEQCSTANMACDDHTWTAASPSPMQDMQCHDLSAEDHHMQASRIAGVQLSEIQSSQNVSPLSGQHNPM